MQLSALTPICHRPAGTFGETLMPPQSRPRSPMVIIFDADWDDARDD